MDAKSPEEWAELIQKLTAFANDKTKTREQRRKAQGILDEILRTPGRRFGRPAKDKRWTYETTEGLYDGTIV